MVDAFLMPIREARPGTLFGEGQIANIAAACAMGEVAPQSSFTDERPKAAMTGSDRSPKNTVRFRAENT